MREKARTVLLRIIQKDNFPEELDDLTKQKPVSRTSRLFPFRPFLDEAGLIRAGGRLERSELPQPAKHPVILSSHHLSQCLLRQYHIDSLHQGVEAVLAAVRQLYCVIGDRRLVRTIKSRCVKCRRYDAKPGDEPSTDLPADRVVFRRPFGLCGVDYAGPLYVKDDTSVGKAWIALFVCGVTRAIHTEVVDSLSAEDFILAWRRFVARRNKPFRVRSDNGTVFVAAAKMIKVDWVFNPPAAPWFGGFYERLVRVIKAPLKKVLGNALLRRKELSTVLAEIEHAVNQRPLTTVGALMESQPLTPAQLAGLDIWPTNDKHSLEVNEEDLSTRHLTQRMRYVQTVISHLKQRWTKEYLVTLNAYHTSGHSRPIRNGDIVLMVDNSKRQLWRMARVECLFAGKDGKHRVARVFIGGKTTLRPIKRLVPLELAEDVCNEEPTASAEDHIASDKQNQQPGPDPTNESNVRHTRTRVISAPNRLDL